MNEWTCRALLFDLDGTLVNSASLIDRHTRLWATRNGLDPDDVLHRSQGLRDSDLVALFVAREAVRQEVDWLHQISVNDVRDLTPIPGAADFLAAVPADRWAVVTSGAEAVARARMAAAGLPVPEVLITAESVRRGKPDPDGYLEAATRLGVPPGKCLAFEDSPVGVIAARAAGAHVISVQSGHRPWPAGPAVDDFRELRLISPTDGRGPLRVLRTQQPTPDVPLPASARPGEPAPTRGGSK